MKKHTQGTGFAALTRGIGQTNTEITANARLIESAPELLECLSELVNAYLNAEEMSEFSSKLAKAQEMISKL